MKKAVQNRLINKQVFWAIGFAILAFGLYAPSVAYDFVYDDDAVVKENKFVHKGLGGIGDIWTTSYFKGFNEQINARAFRPIPLSTLAIEYEFFGLNAKVNHFVNVLLYAFTAFFLFFFLKRLLRAYHILLPAIITLLFVVHPIHVEVVANIKSRDELLAFLFYTISVWFLLKGIDGKKSVYRIAAYIAYLIALFSKESAITTLAVIPLVLWFFRDLKVKKILFQSLPFLGLVVFFLIIRSSIVGGLNEGVALNVLDNSLLAAENTSHRIASNIYVLGVYLYKNLIPYPLLSDYSYSTIPLRNWGDYQVWLSILVYGGMIAAFFIGLKKKWLAAFGIGHYFATVSIFTSVIVLNVSAYNDRFNYNASLGICILISYGFYYWMKKSPKETPVLKVLRNNLMPLVVLTLLSLTAIFYTSQHLPVWESRYTLFEHDVKLAPNNARLLKNHGGSLARKAMSTQDKEERKALATEAIDYLERATNVYFRIGTGHTHLGNMHAILGDYDKAEISFKNALSINSKSYHAKANLANVLYRKGQYQASVDLLKELPETRLTKNDLYLLSLGYNKIGESELAAKYRKLSGR